MKTSILKKVFLSLSLLIFNQILVLAQCGPMMSDPCPPASAEIPVDGGVLGLLAVGAIYGAKRIYDSHKKEK
jgi:hypothetical protein